MRTKAEPVQTLQSPIQQIGTQIQFPFLLHSLGPENGAKSEQRRKILEEYNDIIDRLVSYSYVSHGVRVSKTFLEIKVT